MCELGPWQLQIKVFWTAMGKWYQGKVVEYDSSSGKHRVSFRDGDEKRCILRQEALVWLDIPELSSEAAIKKMREKEGPPVATAVLRCALVQWGLGSALSWPCLAL